MSRAVPDRTHVSGWSLSFCCIYCLLYIYICIYIVLSLSLSLPLFSHCISLFSECDNLDTIDCTFADRW